MTSGVKEFDIVTLLAYLYFDQLRSMKCEEQEIRNGK